jgi:hypothetical protein
MSIKEFFWKVWLRPNLLTENVENDYIAEVSTTGKTLHNEDIAKRIVDEGSEIRYDTILNILNRSDRLIREHLQQACPVQTGYCHISPRVTGSFLGANAKFNKDENKITLDMSLSAEMREALTHVSVEILGTKDSGAYIGLVTDASTGKTDGTVTIDADIIIEGNKLKIAPDQEAGLGVFFENDQAELIPVEHRLIQNDPKKIIARVPSLRSGTYKLKIVTRFTSGGKPLNLPRTLIYDLPLEVN